MDVPPVIVWSIMEDDRHLGHASRMPVIWSGSSSLGGIIRNGEKNGMKRWIMMILL